MYTKDFTNALIFIGESEGGYVNDKDDKGGATKYGISKASYPDLDIEKLTMDDVRRIYHDDYWKIINADRLSSRLSLVLFDTSVNCGIHRTVVWLQQAINEKTTNTKLIPDGVLGAVTLMAINEIDDRTLCMLVLARRMKHYSAIIKRDRNQIKFYRGWMNRITRLLLAVA